MSQVAAVRTPRMRPLPPAVLRTVLPFVSLALMLAAIGWLNPRAISYMGFNLMLNLAIPIALATIAQMFVITVNELDLSVGFFISFIAVVSVTMLSGAPLLGAAVIVGSIFVYAAIGALIHLCHRRNIGRGGTRQYPRPVGCSPVPRPSSGHAQYLWC